MKYTLNVNGQSRTVDVAPDTPLLWVLRDNLDLTGTKYGCGVGQCGACTIHLNGVPARACMTPVSTVGRMKVTTIEGLAEGGKLHPLQKAWSELDVAQCGYCQPGQLMTAAARLMPWRMRVLKSVKPAAIVKIEMPSTTARIAKTIGISAGINVPKTISRMMTATPMPISSDAPCCGCSWTA